jgi:methyl-galactoside transport system permease protein
MTETPLAWKRKLNYKDLFINNAIYAVLFIILVIIVCIEPAFLSFKNVGYILQQASTRMIISMGVAGIIVLGGTDLAAGRMVGMAAILTTSLLQAVTNSRRIFPNLPELPLYLPIVGAMFLCVIFSILHGIVVAKFKVAPFIASLGAQLVIYGIQSLYFEAVNKSSPIGGLDARFTYFAQGAWNIGGMRIPFIVIYAMLIVAFTWLLWNKTRIGKNMFAIGGNVEAATVSGIDIVKNMVLVYAVAGFFYGFAGSLEGARTGSATNTMGAGYELDSIAACVVGGVSLRGGIGSISGVVTGVLLFQVINYGLIFASVSPYIQYIVKGLIIILAVIIDTQKYIPKR